MARYPTTFMCDGPLLEAFEPTVRDDDVFVTTTAKCGQTWLLALLFHLSTRGEYPDLRGQTLLEVTPWLENPIERLQGRPYEVADVMRRLDALPSPRIFKLHVVWDEVPRPPGSKARVITVTRDPRDVPYSMYCHLRGLNREISFDGKPLGEFDEYFEQWMKLGLYFSFVNSFWPHRDDEDFLWLRYEDMQRDLRTVIARLVAFLGWDIDDAAIDRVIGLVDFQRMRRENAQRDKQWERGLWKEGANFFREGAVGKNRQQLSDEQTERLLERARREFEPACFDFVCSLGE